MKYCKFIIVDPSKFILFDIWFLDGQQRSSEYRRKTKYFRENKLSLQPFIIAVGEA